MDDASLLRYSRHLLLNELGLDAQARFAASRALVAGVGGLGNPAAQFLAAAGVGRITLVDADHVDLTNLQRQVLFALDDVGAPKVEAAARRLRAVNPEPELRRVQQRVDADALGALVADADVVLDCTDNFATRHAINRACVDARVPLVSGAAIRFDGQVAVFDARDPASPCYHCLFGEGADSRSALRDDGRVRAAGRHGRRDAGGRSAEAGRRGANRSPAGCCCSTRSRLAGASSRCRAIRPARCAGEAVSARAARWWRRRALGAGSRSCRSPDCTPGRLARDPPAVAPARALVAGDADVRSPRLGGHPRQFGDAGVPAMVRRAYAP